MAGIRPNGRPAEPRDGGTWNGVALMAGLLCIVCVLQGHAIRAVLTLLLCHSHLRTSLVDRRT